MRSDKKVSQQLVAAAIVEAGPGAKQKDIAKTAGVEPITVARYLKEPKFRELVRQMTDAALTFWMPQIDYAMVQKALEGNVSCATYVAKRAGRLTEVVEDKSFSEFKKGLERADIDQIQFYMDHGRWPDDDAAEMMPEPEKTQ